MQFLYRALALLMIISICITFAACDGTPDVNKDIDTPPAQGDAESDTESQTKPEIPFENDSSIDYPDIVLPESVDALIPSIVKLYCYDYDKKEVTSHGCGFFIDENGTFVTNAHVVEKAYSVKARVHTGEFYDVDAIYSYSINNSDYAICSISGYSSVPVEFDSEPTLGEKVYALGYPGSVFRFYASEGEVVNTEREALSVTYLENTAVIYPGNSGGILANADGEVLGIVTGSLTGGEFLAIPYSEFAADLEKREDAKTIFEKFHKTSAISLTEHNAPTFFKISTVSESAQTPPKVTVSLRQEYVDGKSLVDLAGASITVTVALIDENGNTVGNLLHFMFASRQEMIDGETFTLDSSELPKGNFGLRIVAAVGDIITID